MHACYITCTPLQDKSKTEGAEGQQHEVVERSATTSSSKHHSNKHGGSIGSIAGAGAAAATAVLPRLGSTADRDGS
jgi:hypothetical protein